MLDVRTPRNVEDIARRAGLEFTVVRDALHELRSGGEAHFTLDGWRRGPPPPHAHGTPPAFGTLADLAGMIAGEPTLAASNIPEPTPSADQPTTEEPMPRPKKTTAAEPPRKKRKYTRRAVAAQPQPSAPQGDGALTFALTERREIAIDRRDGTGERALVGAADALRLAAFISMVRPALEGA